MIAFVKGFRFDFVTRFCSVLNVLVAQDVAYISCEGFWPG